MYSTSCDLTVQTILNFRENAAAVCVTLQPDDSEQNSLFKGAERFSHFAYIVGIRSGRQALSVYRLWRGNNSPSGVMNVQDRNSQEATIRKKDHDTRCGNSPSSTASPFPNMTLSTARRTG